MTQRLFLDLDGTVYLSGRIIDRADEELRRLADLGVAIHYMTNNTSYNSKEYNQKLETLGLPVMKRAVITPTLVLADWLRENNICSIYTVGTAAFSGEVQDRARVALDETEPECVIVAFDRELTYDKLATACALINRGIPWYLTHIDLACPSANGPIPDCGSIGRLITATTGIEPKGHFGKPGSFMLNYIRSLIEPADVPIVAGDRLYTDVEVGLQLEATTVVVCTGEFQPSQHDVDPRVQIHSTLSSFLKSLLASPNST